MQTKKRLYFNIYNGRSCGEVIAVDQPSFSVSPEAAFSRRGESPSVIAELTSVTAPVVASELNPIGASYGWSWKR